MRLEPEFLTATPRKTPKASLPELSGLRGLPDIHLCYLLLAQSLLLAEKGDFVLSCPVDICDLELETVTAAAEL